jgi:uncharacterized membrane protein YhaH (DUF805 family)
VSAVLNAIAIGEIKDTHGVSRDVVLNLLCQSDYINTQFRSFLLTKMTNDFSYAVFYLRATDHDFTSKSISDILMDDNKYSNKQRGELYLELVRAFDEADQNKKRRLVSVLSLIVIREMTNLKNEEAAVLVSEREKVVARFDKFFKRYQEWAKSEARLKVLEFITDVEGHNPTVYRNDYLTSEIASLKRYLAGRLLISRLTLGFVSSNYTSHGTLARLLQIIGLIAILSLFLQRGYRLIKKTKRTPDSNSVAPSIKESSVYIVEGLAKNVSTEENVEVQKCGLTRWGFGLGLALTIFAVWATPYLFKWLTFWQYAGMIGLGTNLIKNAIFVYLIFFLICIVVLTIQRLRNAGMSSWYGLVFFFPLVGFLVLIWCLSRQESYMKTKRLDSFGKFVATICFICLIAPFIFWYANFKMSRPQIQRIQYMNDRGTN